MKLRANTVEIEKHSYTDEAGEHNWYKLYIFDLDAKQPVEPTVNTVFVEGVHITTDSDYTINKQNMDITVSNDSARINS